VSLTMQGTNFVFDRGGRGDSTAGNVVGPVTNIWIHIRDTDRADEVGNTGILYIDDITIRKLED